MNFAFPPFFTRIVLLLVVWKKCDHFLMEKCVEAFPMGVQNTFQYTRECILKSKEAVKPYLEFTLCVSYVSVIIHTHTHTHTNTSVFKNVATLSVTCSICEEVCFGESGGTIGSRIKEHLRMNNSLLSSS